MQINLHVSLCLNLLKNGRESEREREKRERYEERDRERGFLFLFPCPCLSANPFSLSAPPPPLSLSLSLSLPLFARILSLFNLLLLYGVPLSVIPTALRSPDSVRGHSGLLSLPRGNLSGSKIANGVSGLRSSLFRSVIE